MLGYIPYTEHCYSEKEYKLIRDNNRRYIQECLWLGKDVEGIPENELTHKYKISISGRVYYFDHWILGIKRLRNHYGENMFKYSCFNVLFSAKNTLPPNIDYVIHNDENKTSLGCMSYMSNEAVFTVQYGYMEDKYTVYKGDIDKITSGYYDC